MKKQIALSGGNRFIPMNAFSPAFQKMVLTLSTASQRKLEAYLAWKLLGTVRLDPKALFQPGDLTAEQELQVKHLLEITSLAEPSNRKAVSAEDLDRWATAKTKASEIVVPDPLVEFDPEELECRATWTGHLTELASCTISQDGKTLVSVSQDQIINLWDLVTGDVMKTYQGESCVAISPDCRRYSSGMSPVEIFDIASGKCLSKLEVMRSLSIGAAFSPDGNLVASVSGVMLDNSIKILDISLSKQHKDLEEYDIYGKPFIINSDGKTLLVVGTTKNKIKIWDIGRGRFLKTLSGHTDSVKSFTTSTDGRKLITGSNDNTIKIWNIASGRCSKTLKGHSGYVSSVATSPDGKTLVSGSSDKTIKIWDMASGKCLKTLKGHSGCVNSVAISPDGKTLVSGSSDKTIKIWGNPK